LFTAADDAKLGVKVVHSRYPDGEEGIQKSLATICQKIRDGAPTAAMKSFAANVMREYGLPTGARAQGAAALDHIRKNVLYAPDALGTEQIQSANITLCVEGAPICIPCGDCDDLVTALGTELAALGLEVRVVRQIFGGGHQQHVLIEVKDEDGMWFPLDPSSKTMPAGQKVPAQEETYHSPFDDAPPGAQFVGIGALPMFRAVGRFEDDGSQQVWKHERWEQIGLGAPLEQVAASCCSACDKKKEDAMTHHEQRPHFSRPSSGFGAPWPGVTAFVPQWAWLRQFWPAFDAQSRSWEDTIHAAYLRGEAKKWVPNDPVSRSDLTALILASAFSARAVSTMPDQGLRASDALNRTWYIIAEKLGYTPDTTIDSLKSRVQKEQNPTTAAAQIALFELLIIVVYVAALAVVYCFAIYFAAKIIDSLLARIVAFAELIYLQIQVQKIVDRHLADPNLPWTDAEKKMLDNLEALQRGAHNAVTAAPALTPPGSDETPAWVWIGGGVVVVGGVLAIVYRDEIKRWLNRSSHKQLSAGEARRRRRAA